MNTRELKVERIRKNITQKEIANKVGMAVTSYHRKENGKRSFSCDEIKEIIKVLDLSNERTMEIFFTD